MGLIQIPPVSSGGVGRLKELLTRCKTLPNIAYNPGSPTNYTLPLLLMGNTITIGDNATLRGAENRDIRIITCDKLVLNGVIEGWGVAGITNSSGGGAGGIASQDILILTRKIEGNGIIRSNGGNGGNGISPTGSSTGPTVNRTNSFMSNHTTYDSYVATAQSSPSSLVPGSGGVPLFSYLPWAYIFDHLKLGLIDLWLNIFETPSLGMDSSTWNTLSRLSENCGGNGAPGTADNSTTANFAHGSGGAGSVCSVGGNGGKGPDANTLTGSSGGGGGSGGTVMVASLEPIPAITLSARGGNAGNSFGNAGGSGGGAGGLVIQLCPSTLAIVDVTHGNGAPAGSGTGSQPGLNGEAGQSLIYFLE